jgi:hypothetical protein
MTYCSSMSLTIAEALALDAAGDWERRPEVEATLIAAAYERLDDYDLVLRTLNYLFFSGTSPEHYQALLTAVLDRQAIDEQLVCSIIIPTIGMMIERGEYNQAQQLLDRIPDGIETELVHELSQELIRWFRVENEESVVNWERLAGAWWQAPPSQLPALHQGQPLVKWLAARLSYYEENEVSLRCGWGETGQDEPCFGYITQSYQTWLADGGPQLQPGEQHQNLFWEIGVYGAGENRCHYQLPVPSSGFWHTLADAWPEGNRYLASWQSWQSRCVSQV